MGTQANTGRLRRGRPRVVINPAAVRRLRDRGWTLDQIAKQMACGRGTIARALEMTPAPPRRADPLGSTPLPARAAELARSRSQPAGTELVERERLREHARHLVHRRWGDGMRVEGRPFPPPDPPQPDRSGPRWTGVLLMIGGILLWAAGCPAPL
jgi:hypothetical protein